MRDKFVEKILSGRYFSTLVVVSTYCGIMLYCTYLLTKKVFTVESFLGVLAGFNGLATLIIKSYFDRNDRKPEGGENA